MRITVWLLVCGLLAVNAASINHDSYPFEKEINEVNSFKGSTWTAGRQKRFEGMTEKDVEILCGVLEDKNSKPLQQIDIQVLNDIPTEFDSRTKWPNCVSIGEIRDQSNCGSCWAFGAVEAMSDRYCIETGHSLEISAEDLMDCCKTCGDGCEGGFPGAAWEYWVEHGIVTGGLYVTPSAPCTTCKPYSLPSCEHHISGPKPNCSGHIARTPHCKSTCRSSYNVSYDMDKHKGSSAYSVSSSVEKIQTEIMMRGPVEASFTVYSDFPGYKSGVYVRHHGSHELGGHAVKILGWGEDNGILYWLVANSWNPDWGDKGYFKILRGKDECGIEAGITAGKP